jgi:hypothetical protein
MLPTKWSNYRRLTTIWRMTTKRNGCDDDREAVAHEPAVASLAIAKRRLSIASPNRYPGAAILSPTRKPVSSQPGSIPSACWSIRISNADPPVAVAVEAATKEIRAEVGAGNVFRGRRLSKK